MQKNLPHQAETRAVIKTPQELVHIRHEITLRQYKYWLLMLRSYREAHEQGTQPNERGFFQVSYATIETFLGYEVSRVTLREDLTAIRREEIVYNVMEKDGGQIVRGAGFISEWEISASGIGFKLPDFLQESVKQLDIRGSIFHALNWSIFNSFAGKYAAIIYKLCKDYVGVGRTPVIGIEDLRKYLGIKDTEYLEFKDLNKYLISQPIKSINASEISDITVESVFTRENRKITKVQFLVSKRRQLLLDLTDDPAFALAKVPIPLAQQQAYLASRPAELIALAIERANTYGEAKQCEGGDVNYGALYRKAINEDWGTEQLAKKLAYEESQKTILKQADLERISEAENRNSALRSQFNMETKNAAIKAVSGAKMTDYVQRYKLIGGKVESYDVDAFTFGDSLERSKFKNWLRESIKIDENPMDFKNWLDGKNQ